MIYYISENCVIVKLNPIYSTLHRVVGNDGAVERKDMAPIRQFVLKVHSNCNLRCTYCYVYNGADQSWKKRPPIVLDQVMTDTACRIGEHVRKHDLEEISVVFHGGEPFMARLDNKLTMITYIRKIREAVGSNCQVRATVQTNGTLLTRNNIKEMEAERISIGVSLDGGTPELNRLRVTIGGKPAFGSTVKGIKLLAARPKLADGFHVYAGLLCTIDVNTDAGEVYNSFKMFKPLVKDHPLSINFLILHANHDSPPPMPKIRSKKIIQQWEKLSTTTPANVPDRVTPLGDWLSELFDCWADDEDDSAPDIPLFESMISVNQMSFSTSDEVGLSDFGAIVIETDGSIELDDDLKSVYENAPFTGLKVATSTIDEAARHPGITARQMGKEGLPTACGNCIFNEKCGGGNYAHRYKAGSFDNSSVYCEDLKVIFSHIAKETARLARLFQRQA